MEFQRHDVGFFEVKAATILSNYPVPIDLYLVVNSKPILFRPKGSLLTTKRVEQLHERGRDYFLVREEERGLFLGFLRSHLRNPSVDSIRRLVLLKESIFICLLALFRREDLAPLIADTATVMEDLVDVVGANSFVISQFMQLSRHHDHTFNHCLNVSVYSVAIANKLYGFQRNFLLEMGLAGLLHDLGKRDISPSLLNKPGPFTLKESKLMMNHPLMGWTRLKKTTKVPASILEAVYQHHENHDGSGYPEELKGEDISLPARIVSIADVFDTLTIDRPYGESLSGSKAIRLMADLQPGKFDPDLFQYLQTDFGNA